LKLFEKNQKKVIFSEILGFGGGFGGLYREGPGISACLLLVAGEWLVTTDAGGTGNSAMRTSLEFPAGGDKSRRLEGSVGGLYK
jgi:hypothetical protein